MPTSVDNLHIFLAFDYSQAEIRILAETSRDRLLIEQLNKKGSDIHSEVGHALTGWPIQKIIHDHATRRIIKAVHFGIVYGLSREGVPSYLEAKGVKAKPATAKQYYDAYFKKYAGVKRWLAKARRQVDELGYAENIFGFVREIKKVDKQRGTYWANQAVNSPIQGAAHQLLLIGIAILYLQPKVYNLLQLPLAEVHDSLYFRVRVKDIFKAYEQGMHLLQVATTAYVLKHFKRRLAVPFVAEAKVGFCLGSMVEYEGQSTKEILAIWRKRHVEVEKSAWEELMPTTA